MGTLCGRSIWTCPIRDAHASRQQRSSCALALLAGGPVVDHRQRALHRRSPPQPLVGERRDGCTICPRHLRRDRLRSLDRGVCAVNSLSQIPRENPNFLKFAHPRAPAKFVCAMVIV